MSNLELIKIIIGHVEKEYDNAYVQLVTDKLNNHCNDYKKGIYDAYLSIYYFLLSLKQGIKRKGDKE